MIMELEINGARVIISGENLSVSVSEEADVAQTNSRTNDVEPLDGSQVRDLRKRMGVNQQELAKKFCVQQSTVSRWERGSEQPRGPAFVLLKMMLAGEAA